VDQKIEIGKKPLFRYIVMGRKSLPETTKRTRPYWGFVELVTTNPDDLKKMLAAGVLIEWVEIDHGIMMHPFFFGQTMVCIIILLIFDYVSLTCYTFLVCRGI
jgi:hypothetical protein